MSGSLRSSTGYLTPFACTHLVDLAFSPNVATVFVDDARDDGQAHTWRIMALSSAAAAHRPDIDQAKSEDPGKFQFYDTERLDWDRFNMVTSSINYR
jgi:hypothetical protein